MLADAVVAPGEFLVAVVAEAEAAPLLLLHLSETLDRLALHRDRGLGDRFGRWRRRQREARR